MLGLTAWQTYYYYLNFVDMRKGFNSLSGIVQDNKNENQDANIVYTFIYKRKDKLKLLHWRVGGFVQYYKRL